MTSIEPREANIVVVTRGGVVTRPYQDAHHGQMQIRPAAQNKFLFNVHKEKEVFFDIRLEFVDTNQSSTSG